MKVRTRLLLFVVLPLVIAVGAVTSAISRQAAAPGVARRPLPATTQVVSGRAGLAWSPPLDDVYAAIGFLEPDGWYAATRQRTTGGRPNSDLVGGDARGGLMRVATNLRFPFTGPGVESGGVLYAPVGTSDLTAIDLMTLRPLWTADVGARAARVAVADGRVIATTDRRIACFDATSGKALWTANVPGITTSPALAGRYACFGTADTFHVLDAATGRELRKVAVTGLSGWIAARGDLATVCAAVPDRLTAVTVYCINLEHGWVQWKHTADELVPWVQQHLSASGPTLAGDTVLVALADRLCALDVQTGQRRWVWRTEPDLEEGDGAPSRRLSSGPLLAGPPAMNQGVVYVSWGTSSVSGLDASSGREVWRFQATSQRRGTQWSLCPPVVGNGLLLCVTGGGALCALKCDLIPTRPPAANVTAAAARPVNLSWALGAASSVLLVGIILGVFGLWRFMIATICLLLCGLTVFAWWRSYAASEFVGQQVVSRQAPFERQVRRGVTSRNGGLTFGASTEVWSTVVRRGSAGKGGAEFAWVRQAISPDAAAARQGLVRFAWVRQSRSSGSSLGSQAQAGLTVPHWVVAAVLAVAPLAWLCGAWRDRRRYPRGHCRDCGYDLRGLSGRCPECGLEIPPGRVPSGRRVRA